MRLYHPHFLVQIRFAWRRFVMPGRLALIWCIVGTAGLAALFLSACGAQVAAPGTISAGIIADDKLTTVNVPPGSTVQSVLQAANLVVNPLDRVDPPVYTVIAPGTRVRIVRVTEKFEVEQSAVPYERQIVRNESLPSEREVLLQKGKNGLQEITYRRVYEDGVEIPGKPVPIKVSTIEEPVPEIVMIGVQAPFYPVAIPGRIVYIRDGSAWMMQDSTSNRRALVTTGDLDGRILALSPDGSWLMFSRRSTKEGQINSLWATNLLTDTGKLIDLKVVNVVHFADWVPGIEMKIIFSTVEARAAAPGWQANNDLNSLSFSRTGWVSKWSSILNPNTGGIYGWWGTRFNWAPQNPQALAYTRPDSIGLVNYKDGTQTTTFPIIPLQTRGDWAWVPGLAWGADGKTLFIVEHTAPPGSTSPEESPDFDLTAIPLVSGPPIHLVHQVGMFAYPLASPAKQLSSGEIAFQVAFLKAIFSDQSETSRYRLAVIDRDGSNQRVLFPAGDRPGLTPQEDWGAWSPLPLAGSDSYQLALIYQGNLWLVNAGDGKAQQITGDGLTTRIIWK